ncbi:DMT family transporter [Microbulbifer sp. CAU 1566]|uniref:DMT family transporter n=1 Tax=Microbulbifer sp. CAU 1566 TaxID=2933269 RepID=UPI002004B5EF|nr:DMT family transporter [Microbulbifer sp. CAU 1566]MCK7597090.1 DMT family transporter [Microbulbifer sp. CAU 1566]
MSITLNSSSGFLLALGAAALFSIKAIFVKLAYRHGVDVETFIFLRMALALPFYLAILALLHKQGQWRPVSRRNLILTIALGLCSYYLASFLDLQGLRYISANFERLIIYLYPTLVLILGWLFLGKGVSMRQVLCILGAYVGILVIYWQDQNFTTGVLPPQWVSLDAISWGALLTFGSALSFSLYVAFSEQVIKTLGSRQFTALAMMAASAAIALHFTIQGDWSRLQQPWQVYSYALVVAFVCTVIPSLMMSAAIQQIGSASTGAIGTSGPVVTLVAAALVLGEPFSAIHLLGMAIIIGSLVLLKGSNKSAAPAKSAAPSS